MDTHIRTKFMYIIRDAEARWHHRAHRRQRLRNTMTSQIHLIPYTKPVQSRLKTSDGKDMEYNTRADVYNSENYSVGNFSDRFSEHEDFLTPAASIFALIGVISTVGNLLLIYTFCRVENLWRNAANLYTINLASNNAALGAVATRLASKILLKDGPTHECQVEGFFLSTVHINVMLTIAVLFADRYVVICKSASRDCILAITHYKPLLVIAFVWLHSAFWAMWPLTPIVPNYTGEEVLPCCLFDRKSSSVNNVLYLVLMSLSAFILPLIFICWCMVQIFGTVRKSSLRIKQYGRRIVVAKTHNRTSSTNSQKDVTGLRKKPAVEISSETNEDSLITGMSNVKQNEENNTGRRIKVLRSSLQREKNISPEQAIMKSAVILVTTYAISWTPFLFMVLISLSGVQLNFYLLIVSILFSKASCVHSSYAYVTNHHYRATVRMVTCFPSVKIPCINA